jgi:hypothetical protein
MNVKLVRVLVVLLLTIQFGYTQNLTRTDVSKIKIRSTGVIEQNGQVKGYFYFYNLEKKKKGISNYLLSVVDENLQEVNSVTISRSTTYELIESSYNGTAFVFLFFDSRAKIIELISYDNSLKQIGSKLEPIKGGSGYEVYKAIGLGGAAQQRFLVPIDNKGFVNYSMSGPDNENYKINFLANDLKVSWSQSSKQRKMMESASEGFQSVNYFGSIIFKTKSVSSKGFGYGLLVNDVVTGSQLFQVDLSTTLFSITPNDVHYDSVANQVVVFGEYFEKGDKQLKKQSQGFCYLTYDMTGNQVNSKTISWADISQQAPVNSSGKFDGINTNVLFHEFVRTADGKVFAIGEQYKKAVSGAGVALQILSIAASAAAGGGYIGGSNASSVQMNVYNMVVFQFTPDFALEKVQIFEKNMNQILLPSGSTYMSTKLLSYYVKAIGGFDYTYSQKLPDDAFTFVYTDADRKTATGIIGAVVYTPEKTFSVDKVKISKKSTDFAIVRAKAGYFLIIEYFKKEKKLDMRLEKFNY